MKPYLSIVATSRNDGHGGNIMKRMQLFVKGLLHQTRKYNFPAELIMVEWNPPADQPLLHEVLPQPGPEDKLTIRYIIVPNSIHNTYSRGDAIPLYQMIAKNVGIRRAMGEFILCTNIDLLFADELFEILVKKDLRNDRFYRANRCDVPDKMELDWNFEQQVEFAKNNIIRRIGKNPEYMDIGNVPSSFYKFKPLTWVTDKAYALKHILTESSSVNAFRHLDSNACGDFTLMSKDAWEDLQGYIELDLYSLHIDTLGIIGAASLGYKQHIFPTEACTYHIDHPTGWEAMSTIERIKFWEERPGVGFDSVWDSAMIMLKTPTHFNLNKPDWGWANEHFEEIILSPERVKQEH